MKPKIDYNLLLAPLFHARRANMNWTEWAKHLKKIKVKREWVSLDGYGPDSDELVRVINSYKTSRYVYVIGGQKSKRGHSREQKIELLLVPRVLAQKILVLGGVP